ncbi:TetR/AcrR family transcriptional regulator [Nocardia sp. 2]|uniref:TetR/AcrR family transcriptional regulator n=1 Tax=Nocardia acididurans TaxID=2802282 RepID=A0ABS1M358_9NOCA|nr:TetR/AcrR family transcriptional regulator [Nocardia acididurans]MBL1074766.1 TetR/AcrR family transcriptional regulator [Nocardia acididurans]
MAKRGPYGKGIERREQILEAALRTIAERGFLSTSVAELAEAVGLSQSGLLHYFGSKEELFVAVLRKRDEVDAAAMAAEYSRPESLLEIVRRNIEVPGLVELFTHMQAAAADPRHPAHEYMHEHYRTSGAAFAELLRDMQRSGDLPAHVDPGQMATVFLALTDGLQSRWLIDPTIDMAAHLRLAWDRFTAEP